MALFWHSRRSPAVGYEIDQTPDGPQVWSWLGQQFLPGVQLAWQEGPHTLLISYNGRQPDREAVVDAFLIIPAVACKHLENDDGRLLTVCHDMQTAETIWEEKVCRCLRRRENKKKKR